MTTETMTPLVKSTQPGQSTVTVDGYFYIVNFGDPISSPHHHVGINGECTCTLGRLCPAVEEVRKYLRDGGKRADRPPFGFYPVIPAKCPIKGCGARVYFDASLGSRNRGAGWRCSKAGADHYWKHRAWISSRRSKLTSLGKDI